MGPGEFAGLTAAGLWALASLLYGRTRLTAFGMNYGKSVIASGMLLIHLIVVSLLNGTPLFRAGGAAWLWLSFSGLTGIVAGDTFYFRSLQILGARRALVVATTSPLFAALLGWLLLGEVLSAFCMMGIVLTLSGVCVVTLDRRAVTEAPGLYPGTLADGVTIGIAGAWFNAAGAVASRFAMAGTDPVEAAFIRILVAALASAAMVAAAGRFRDATARIVSRDVLPRFFPAVLCGTWLGIWLSQVAYKYSPVAIATTLTSTTPVFAIPLVWIFLGQRTTLRGFLGTLIAVIGVWLTIADPESFFDDPHKSGPKSDE